MLKTKWTRIERHLRRAGYNHRPKITVTADGSAVVSHAGTRLLADLADRTTLTAELSQALDGVRGQRPGHDPGRVLVDLAVVIADGGEAISDIAVLADQPAVFGAVASDSTCWRLLDALGEPQLAGVAAARARAREVAWAQRAETTGAAFDRSRVAGTAGVDALVIDLDAHIVVCHSEKQQAAPPFKHSFGYHPLLAFLDNTDEFLAARLRAGNAGSNTAADHIAVLDAALEQIPDAYRHGDPGPRRRRRRHQGVPGPMGGDDDPHVVADWQGRVRGIDNLRVADASILPDVPSIAPLLTIIMAAERPLPGPKSIT